VSCFDGFSEKLLQEMPNFPYFNTGQCRRRLYLVVSSNSYVLAEEMSTLPSFQVNPSSRANPSIVWPVIMIVVGMLALWLPVASSIGVTRVLGWLMVIDAGFQFVYAFRSEGVGPVVWKLLVAIVYLVAGIYFLMHPFLAVAVLTLGLAVFFLVEGVVDVFSYFATRTGGPSYWILVNGIVSIVLAIMIWRHWPTGSLWVLGVLVGIGMLMTGVSRLMIAVAIRAYAKHGGQEPRDTLRAA
jgi:uncharacterized membrane protein HdeD (DUF308 family)